MTATVRLNPTDEMLHRAADTLGSSRIVQVLWTFRDPVPVTALRAAWDGLDQGWLSRRARSSPVPGARRSWVPARNEEALGITSTPLTDATLGDWIDAQVKAPLLPGSSALWRLAAAPYGAGTLVSLTVPHFRCDGLGIFRAIGSGGDDTPDDTHRPTAGPGLLDDLADLAQQTLRGGLAAARWLPATLTNPERLDRIRTALRPPDRPEPPPNRASSPLRSSRRTPPGGTSRRTRSAGRPTASSSRSPPTSSGRQGRATRPNRSTSASP